MWSECFVDVALTVQNAVKGTSCVWLPGRIPAQTILTLPSLYAVTLFTLHLLLKVMLFFHNHLARVAY